MWRPPDPLDAVVVWRDQAEHAAESLTKGSRVVVLGKLQQRTWTAEDGSARSTVEVAKMEPEFGAGKFGIDRLVRIKARFPRSKLSWASHAISFETFLIRLVIYCQIGVEFSKLIARESVNEGNRTYLQNRTTAIPSYRLCCRSY